MSRLGVAVVIAIVALAAGPSVAAADRLEDIFRAGNEAYFRGEFAAAATEYERLWELGVRDADVLFNLGNAYARMGEEGRAVAAFQRALAIRPGDPGALAAEEQVQALLARRRADRTGEATVGGTAIRSALFGGLGDDALAWLVLVLELLACGGAGAWLLLRPGRSRTAVAAIGGVALAGLAVFSPVLLVRSGVLEEGEPAIVVRPRARLREGPRDDARERARADEGERAAILERDGEWARVRVASGREGWLPLRALVPLSLE